MIWLFVALTTIVVIGALLLPLFRDVAFRSSRQKQEITIFADQLAELEREAAAGLISAEAAAATRIEIERRILASGGDGGSVEPNPATDASGSARMVAVVLVASLAPLAAFAIYLATGAPNEPSYPYAGRGDGSGDAAMTAGEMMELVDKLAARLEQEPDNVEGWKLLARSYSALQRPADAAAAYGRAHELDPGNHGVAADYAEVLVQANDGKVSQQAQSLLILANRADPAAPKPRYYLAIAKAQAGNRHDALAMLKSLELDSPGDAPWLAAVRERIQEIAKEAGIDPKTVEAKSVAQIARPAGPSEEDVQATQSMTPEQQQEMIRGMVEGLAKRLEANPNDLEGWKRLGQSYFVLNEPVQARDAYARAVALAPTDHNLLVKYAGTVLAAPEPMPELPAESIAALQAALERQPTDGTALWLLGFASLKDGNSEQAREFWSKLLTQFAPGSGEYKAVEGQIAKLPSAQ
jgi:cytochrome c-type biogenesis protein CcmH